MTSSVFAPMGNPLTWGMLNYLSRPSSIYKSLLLRFWVSIAEGVGKLWVHLIRDCLHLNTVCSHRMGISQKSNRWVQCCGSGSGSGAFLTPGSGMKKKIIRIRYPGWTSRIIISESLETGFRVKNTEIHWRSSGIRNFFDPGSGMENSDPGYIPDLQHWMSVSSPDPLSFCILVKARSTSTKW